MGYGVTPHDTCSIFVNAVLLSKSATVWPDPQELFLGGSKLQCYETLRIASLSMGISTPFCATIDNDIRDPAFIKEFSGGSIKAVIKRDYSMKCEHVLLPSTPNAASKVKECIRIEKETWEQVRGLFGMPVWFVQPIVAHLLHVGEVRCFIGSGRLVYKVITTPGQDFCWEVTNNDPIIRPLHTHW
jgi:hypothetical protein